MVFISTNSMAKKLAEYKVSRVSVSIDSMDEKVHDEIRGRKDSWRRAIEALEHVKNAGMDPYLNITVGHYNANTEHFKQLLDYSKQKRYKTLLNVAVPSGMWQNAEGIICDDKDRNISEKLGKNIKNLVRNVWNPFDKNHEKILGCTTVNRLYVTPIGDVLVCPYVHIKIGNIFKSSLKDIVDFGFRIKHFRNHSDLCLAGEDKNFISKFMTKSGQSIFKPALAEEIFEKKISFRDVVSKKVAVITGCNKGIGKKILENFSENGAIIYAGVRTITKEFQREIKDLENKIKNKIEIFQIDLSDEKKTLEAANSIISKKKNRCFS